MAIESHLKQRLVGIAVIVSLAVIFLPMILDGAGMIEKNQYEQITIEVPPPPKIERRAIDLDAKAQQLNERLANIPKIESPVVDEINKNKVNEEKPKFENKLKTPEATKKLGGDTWIAQLGSFKDQDKAFKLQDKVRDYKIAAVFIQKVVLESGKSYRVRMGPFLFQKQAKAAVDKLFKKHKLKAVVMKHDQ